jgi:hypothetical protein
MTEKHLALTLSAFVWFISGFSASSQTEICKTVKESINHPVEMIAIRVQKSFSSLQCIAAPHCCGPTWEAHPECYTLQNQVVREPWTEIKETMECLPRSSSEALSEFIENHTDPAYILTKPIYDLYQAKVATAISQAEPIPQPFSGAMEAIIGHLRTISWVVNGPDANPINLEDIADARWVDRENPLAISLSPMTWGQSNPAITHDKLIVIDVDEYHLLDKCEKFAFWVHEVIHVAQYRNMGAFNFTKNYLSESQSGVRYEDLSAEVGAKRVEIEALDFCVNEPWFQAMLD